MNAKTVVLGQVRRLHKALVLNRRSETLARAIADILPGGIGEMLDVGCGDGSIAQAIGERTPGLRVRGIDVLCRDGCFIQCTAFDGRKIPFADQSFDVVSTVDVLHHTENITELVLECTRVSRRYVVIKDHLWQTELDRAILSVMDWVGNRAHGVSLPDNYQKRDDWARILDLAALRTQSWDEHLGLYPPGFDLVFGRGKHFIGLFEKL